MAMDLKLIQNILKITISLAVLGFVFVWANFNFFDGLSLGMGALWSCVNLYFIEQLIKNILIQDERSPLRLLKFIGLKFPVLYLTGFLLLKVFSPIYLLIGFSLLILSVFSCTIWRFIPKAAAVLLILFITTEAQASLMVEVPEVPNIITLLHKKFHDSSFIKFLHTWESLIFAFLISTIISLVFYFGSRHRNLIPSGLQNFLEWMVELLRKFILEVLGPSGEKYVPFLGTLFIYILFMNWMVLIPFMKAPSSNFNITVALALCVFVLVQYLNIKNYGVLGFLYHLAGSPKGFMGWALVPLMLPIEILTQFTRPLTLALRLFGNVLGEDILIGAFALFGVYALASWDYPVGLPLQIPFMFLAMLTSLMQALVFTLLSTIYILLSTPEHEKVASD
jgi:F-type H+-transporting ATPase subunit a